MPKNCGSPQAIYLLEASVHIDWGSVPAYFGGLALLLTIVTLQRDHKERRGAQASKVAAWAVPPSHADGETKFHIRLRNASELPVTSVRVVISVERTERKMRLRKDQGPEGPLRNVFYYRNVLAPGATEDVREFSSPVEVKSLDFIDSSGRTWYRTKTRLFAKPPWRKPLRQAKRKARWNQLLKRIRQSPNEN
jgi:hypothetical protein